MLWKQIFSLALLFSFLNGEETNVVIATIGVGDTPAGIAITPDSLYAYVANNNNDSLPGGNTVSVLNLTYNTLQQTISHSSFNEPYTVSINPAGTKAYVTNSGGSTVTLIDLATNTVTGTITGFDGPSGFAITPDGNYAYVNNYGAAGGAGSGNGTTIRVVNLNTNSIVGSALTVGQAPAALAITPDGSKVYVVSYVDGNLGTGTISIIHTSNNSVQLNAITGLSGPFAIAITPDGKYAYVTNFGSNNFSPVGTTVSVIDLSSNTIVSTILLGIQPSGIAITPDGSFAYVSNYSTLYNGMGFTDLTSAQGTVDIIDIQTNTVISPIIGVGLAPDAIAISPNGQFAYVTNYASNTVSVIRLPSTLYNIQRLRPHYNLQRDETMTKLNQAGL
jgi:YVTN family beta-propeller protein